MGQPAGSYRYYPYSGSELFTVTGSALMKLVPSATDRFYWYLATVGFSGSSGITVWDPITDVSEVVGVQYLDNVDYVADGLGGGIWDLYDLNVFGLEPVAKIEFPLPSGSPTMTASFEQPDTWAWYDTLDGIPVYTASMRLTPYTNTVLSSSYAFYLFYAASAVVNPETESDLELGCGKIDLTQEGMFMSLMSVEDEEVTVAMENWGNRARAWIMNCVTGSGPNYQVQGRSQRILDLLASGSY